MNSSRHFLVAIGDRDLGKNTVSFMSNKRWSSFGPPGKWVMRRCVCSPAYPQSKTVLGKSVSGGNGSLPRGDKVPVWSFSSSGIQGWDHQRSAIGWFFAHLPSSEQWLKKTLISHRGIETTGRVVLFGIILHITQWNCQCTNTVRVKDPKLLVYLFISWRQGAPVYYYVLGTSSFPPKLQLFQTLHQLSLYHSLKVKITLY